MAAESNCPIRLLFVCSANALRSPTAEAIFSQYRGVEATSAGTNHDAENPVSGDLIEWADLIFAMETSHRKVVQERFGSVLGSKKIIVLGIKDKYQFMDPELVSILRSKLMRFLPHPPEKC
jgi:predicted protein tyrosine phosphatase